jgi:hypothetical protein
MSRSSTAFLMVSSNVDMLAVSIASSQGLLLVVVRQLNDAISRLVSKVNSTSKQLPEETMFIRKRTGTLKKGTGHGVTCPWSWPVRMFRCGSRFGPRLIVISIIRHDRYPLPIHRSHEAGIVLYPARPSGSRRVGMGMPPNLLVPNQVSLSQRVASQMTREISKEPRRHIKDSGTMKWLYILFPDSIV